MTSNNIWLQKQCTLRQVDYGKAAYLDKCATAKTVHYFKNRDKIICNKHQCRQWWSDWKSSPRKEQHSNTKIKYKNTTQDKTKNRGTNTMVWLKTNTAIPKSTILIQQFYKLLIDQIAADQKNTPKNVLNWSEQTISSNQYTV
jgi:hypothetical protein